MCQKVVNLQIVLLVNLCISVVDYWLIRYSTFNISMSVLFCISLRLSSSESGLLLKLQTMLFTLVLALRTKFILNILRSFSNGCCLYFNPNPCAGSTPGAHPLEEAVQCGGQPGQTGDGLDLMVCSLYSCAAHLH